ncbi:DUF1549 domain-containing protein [Armatimonas sp.]|uniref:DUF1549 domain-containing protein n=1 Tax=Armatimonas sp. TaxID=1872638 RepID=UPI00286A083B|nr:DUF1549 domain-containing protein [Armatimonas sp.]
MGSVLALLLLILASPHADAGGATPRFKTDVMPILTRAGCNSGPCHGANAGRGGFHLSLLGFDPSSDYEAMTRFVWGRRVRLDAPDESLILRKASGQLSHGGGERFAKTSPEYAVLRSWVAAGVPEPKDSDPSVTALAIAPERITVALGQSVPIKVTATLSDGTKRDVTPQTLFSSGDGGLVEVTPQGVAKTLAPGEGPVVIRYGGKFATARLLTPFAPPRTLLPATDPLDRLVNARLAALGLPASPRCDDATYLRRASLDIAGQLPTPESVRAFIADPDPKKREKLVDRLLASPEYIDFWTQRWSDLLRSSEKTLGKKSRDAYHAFIRKSVETNKPYDVFATELLTGKGDSVAVPSVNFFRAGKSEYAASLTPLEQGETTAQFLLGVRLQCAQCHNHPYEKWTQKQYFQLAAFYGRVEATNKDTEGVIAPREWGEVHHPKTGEALTPAPLDGPALAKDFKGDRREPLAKWLTAPSNPFFAPLLANRLWKYLFGRGLVEPVDDFRVTNPATNEPLLQALASEVRSSGYDIKKLIRRFVLTETYQRDSRRVPGNERDDRYYSRFFVKRLAAEPLLDALCTATGTSETFPDYPAGTKAVQLKDPAVASLFLDTFGRPLRQAACDCERMTEANLSQALHYLNAPTIQIHLSDPKGRLATMANRPRKEQIEELYLATLSRFPTGDEAVNAAFQLARGVALEDLFWALLSAREFGFNR